ncbi:MAG TPA: class I SAM-dependent methyltransferase [Chloroflexota bacterium]|nr:class I SAM-dependent methyltransferase [Chloroflexota bacterium]HUM69902.1 class I SAM-dependent methyltransferase [Chloroflexota bacterium]
MDKQLVQEQFGTHAADYIHSKPHAKGASLGRLVELVAPQPDWLVLDVATGAGHTAFAFAPLVAQVWATDMTAEMLGIVRQQAAQRGLANVTAEYAEAEALPYGDGRFHLVTCRIAAHHFADIARFMAEAARVLRSGGLLAVVDNVAPAGPAGDYVNAFEKLRDPSHGRCLSLAEWEEAYQAAGLALTQVETMDKEMEFAPWAARHDAVMQRYLRAMLTEVQGEAADFLRPSVTDEGTTFYLQEAILVGGKEVG